MTQLQQQSQSSVIDGFSYSLYRIYSPFWYEANALGQLEALRKSGRYRSREYCVPEDPNELIQGYDSTEIQVKIVPGSFLFGWRYASYDSGQLGNGGQILVKMVEGGTGIPFSQEFIYAGNMGSQIQFGPNRPGQPILMTQPRLITAPGWISVEFANSSPDPSTCQLILMCAEPCEVVEPKTTECAL
jgi:hypothetical protein